MATKKQASMMASSTDPVTSCGRSLRGRTTIPADRHGLPGPPVTQAPGMRV
jgi:hypothetical protein